MADPEHPQIYLISPPAPGAAWFAETLPSALDAVPVACLRLALASQDPDTLGRAADAARIAAHARDVAVVIERHLLLAQKHGLDGVHLVDGARSVRNARKELGPEAIVGAFCGASRHEGMTAGEAGADYVSFGPVSGQLGDGSLAPRELFAWWSEMIEIPVVAEGGVTLVALQDLATVCDFVALGEEIWQHDDPGTALQQAAAQLRT